MPAQLNGTAAAVALMALMLVRATWDRAGRAGYVLDAMMAALALLVLAGAPPALALPAQSLRQMPAFVLAALVTFAASVWLTAPVPLQYGHRLWMQLRAAPAGNHARVALWALAVAGHEELLWRLLCQSALQALLGLPAAVALVALSFAWWHRRRTIGAPRVMTEMAAFALLLGCAFAMTGDVLLVLLMHALRNYFIAMNGRHESC